MKKYLLLSLVFYLSVSANAWGEFYDGNGLSRMCNEPEGTYGNGICHGYIVGVAATKGMLSPSDQYCFPNNVIAGQLEAVVRKFLNEHPDKLHQAAAVLVTYALQEAFPCK